jgi:hypothetical protein
MRTADSDSDSGTRDQRSWTRVRFLRCLRRPRRLARLAAVMSQRLRPLALTLRALEKVPAGPSTAALRGKPGPVARASVRSHAPSHHCPAVPARVCCPTCGRVWHAGLGRAARAAEPLRERDGRRVVRAGGDAPGGARADEGAPRRPVRAARVPDRARTPNTHAREPPRRGQRAQPAPEFHRCVTVRQPAHAPAHATPLPGRRVLESYFLLFLHSAPLPANAKPDYARLAERNIHTYVFGEHVGNGWALGNVMRWTPPGKGRNGKAASIGLYRIAGTAMEALVGGVYHQFVSSFGRASVYASLTIHTGWCRRTPAVPHSHPAAPATSAAGICPACGADLREARRAGRPAAGRADASGRHARALRELDAAALPADSARICRADGEG